MATTVNSVTLLNEFVLNHKVFTFICKVDVYMWASAWCMFGFENTLQELHKPLVQATDSSLEVSLL